MAEEVTITGYAADEDRVSEWELGLPSAEDLTPLSQHLISPELFSAFSITPEPHRSMLEVNRASKNTMSDLRGLSKTNQFKFKSFDEDGGRDSADPLVLEADDADLSPDGSDSRKIRRIDEEEADSSMKSSKKVRLVWTPQLHKRFVEVVAHLGIKNAVPKTIMQLMNVEGLTRENVASHLQKYRLYLKRMEGCSNEVPSASDHLFASTPVPPSLQESGGSSSQAHGNGNGNGYVSPYPPQMMPFYGQCFESHLPYNMVQQHRDWSGFNYGPYHS
jgi:SHAQKYF class myb-like DNA-binding protein